MNILKNKKILITAGPTWVSVDRVRVITNIFSGRLGWIIAQAARRLGSKTVLLMGPGRVNLPIKKIKNLKIINFRYYNEILDLVKKEIGSKKYDIMIHSAAIADYTPITTKKHKIKSGKSNLIIKLKPTIKIINLVKKLNPSIFLVKFKLEVDLPKKELIDVAYNSMLKSKADLIVANNFQTLRKKHTAFIIDPQKNINRFQGKEKIAKGLLKIINLKIN